MYTLRHRRHVGAPSIKGSYQLVMLWYTNPAATLLYMRFEALGSGCIRSISIRQIGNKPTKLPLLTGKIIKVISSNKIVKGLYVRVSAYCAVCASKVRVIGKGAIFSISWQDNRLTILFHFFIKTRKAVGLYTESSLSKFF